MTITLVGILIYNLRYRSYVSIYDCQWPWAIIVLITGSLIWIYNRYLEITTSIYCPEYVYIKYSSV